MSNNSEQDRREYQAKLNEIARELLPAVIQAHLDISNEEQVGYAYDAARAYLLKSQGASPHERQIRQALEVLRDPGRIYENRVAVATGILDFPEPYGNWEKYAYVPTKEEHGP